MNFQQFLILTLVTTMFFATVNLAFGVVQLSLTKEELLMNGKWVFDGNGFNFEPMNDQQKEQYIKEVTKQ